MKANLNLGVEEKSRQGRARRIKGQVSETHFINELNLYCSRNKILNEHNIRFKKNYAQYAKSGLDVCGPVLGIQIKKHVNLNLKAAWSQTLRERSQYLTETNQLLIPTLAYKPHYSRDGWIVRIPTECIIKPIEDVLEFPYTGSCEFFLESFVHMVLPRLILSFPL